MLTAIFWTSVGLLLGWNLIPQPAIIKRRYDAIAAWWKALGNTRIDPFD